MKQKFLFAIASMLLFCTLAFAQTDGIPVELKPYNPPPFPPPYGDGIINPNDSDIIVGTPTYIITNETIFTCHQNSANLTLQCNDDVQVEIVIYEMISGVKHTSIINMVAGEIYTIATPWGAGLYTIRLTLSDGTILEGDFQIR